MWLVESEVVAEERDALSVSSLNLETASQHQKVCSVSNFVKNICWLNEVSKLQLEGNNDITYGLL